MIKTYIEKQNITQSEFAEKANISRQLLNWHLRHPEKVWTYKNAIKIVKVVYGKAIREEIVDLILGKTK